jgi:hypothetical protein
MVCCITALEVVADEVTELSLYNMFMRTYMLCAAVLRTHAQPACMVTVCKYAAQRLNALLTNLDASIASITRECTGCTGYRWSWCA